MNSFRCSNCSLLNFDTAGACKRCGLPFDSEAEPANGPQHYEPSQPSPQDYPQPAEGNSYFWDQPQYQPSYIPPRPAPAPSGGGGKIVGVIVLVAVVGLVAFLAIPKLLKPRTANLANLTWSEYKARDGSFKVSLPAAPKESQMNQATPLGSIPVKVVLAEIDKQSACMVMYADYPQAAKISEEMLYEQTLKSMESAKASHLAPGARKFINHDGHRGIEAEFKPEAMKELDGKARARIFWVQPRLYVVMAAGPETPEFDGVGARCLDSFKFNYGQ